MKKHCLAGVLGLAALTTFFGFATAVHAEIVYDNSTTFEGSFNDSRLETGDEINLAGTSRLITDFSFEYFAEFAPTGDETARLRFYEMNGAPDESEMPTPGTLIYDSGTFSISSGYRTVNITEMSTLLGGNSFTWSVEFTGLTASESAGLLYYNPPTVGRSDAYFWEKGNGVWSAVATDTTGNNFAARVIATNAPATGAFRISALQRQNNVATLAVAGVTPGRSYALDYKNSVASTWQRVPGQASATTENLTLTDSTASVPFRFYRVVQIN